MSVTLALKRMSRKDKLRAMEALWADLSGDDAQYDSPAWHDDALRQASRLVRAGKARHSARAFRKKEIKLSHRPSVSPKALPCQNPDRAEATTASEFARCTFI